MFNSTIQVRFQKSPNQPLKGGTQNQPPEGGTQNSKLKTQNFGFLFFLLLLGCISCGRAGDPIPPVSRSLESTQSLEAFQRGNQIMVRWARPNLTNPRSSGVTQVDIFRFQEPATAPRTMREEIFLEEAQLVGTYTLQQIQTSEGAFLTFEETLDTANPSWRNQRFRYAVRYTDARGQLAPLSNFALVVPSPEVADRPQTLTATTSQEAISLTWSPPAKRLDGTPLGTGTVAYNLYRRGAKGEYGKRPLNQAPLSEPRFSDTKFKFKAEYHYLVRTVTEVRGEMVESVDSEEITVNPVDTFIPEAPQNVTGASAAGVVSLFWPSNAEPDIKGYVIYRAEKNEGGTPVWNRLTPSPITTTTFQDSTGEKGKTYLYQITAVDEFNNESPRSETVSVEVVN